MPHAELATPLPKQLVPVTARGEATRRKLLSAAETEFGAKGFHNASVSSITTQAGVGQGTFYLYFRSKEEVFINLVRDIGRNLYETMSAAHGATGERVNLERRSLEAFLGFAQAHPGLFRIVQEAQFVDDEAFRSFYDSLANAYREGLQLAAARGEIVQGDAEVRAWALLGIGHFIGMRYCTWEGGSSPDPRIIDDALELIHHGIASRREVH